MEWSIPFSLWNQGHQPAGFFPVQDAFYAENATPSDRFYNYVTYGEGFNDDFTNDPGYEPVEDDEQDADPDTDPDPPPPRNWKQEAQALYPWLSGPLLNIYTGLWKKSGDANLALAQLRAGQRVADGKIISDSNATYENAFPGIVRDDGTLRMTELEWFSTREAYGRLFSDFGLNPTLFEDKYTELIEGEVSAQELAGRLGGAYEQIVGQIPEVKEQYAAWFGAEGMSDQAIFASFIDPDLGDAILNRRISVAQVGGEGLARGFDVEQGFAERLVSGGVDRGMARNFFVQAEGQLQTLDDLVLRHRDADDTFDLEEFAAANVFGSAEQTRRIRRLLRAEASLFTPRDVGTVQTEQDFASTGLSPR